MQNAEPKKVFAVHVPWNDQQPIKAAYSMSGIQSFHISIVEIEDGDKVRNPSDYDEQGRAFKDLEFRSQVDYSHSAPYGMSLEYRNAGNVDLRRAESMLKMLRKIAKAEDKLPVRPATFGQYVALLAAAVGITKAVTPQGRSNGWHHETTYTFWKISDAQFLIDSRIEAFVKEHAESMTRARSW